MSQRLENVLDQNEQMIKNDEKLGLVKEFGQLFLILYFYQSTLNRVSDNDVSDQLCLYR